MINEQLYQIVLLQHKLLKEIVNTWNPEVQKALADIESLILTIEEKEKNGVAS